MPIENQKTAEVFDSYGDTYGATVNQAVSFTGLNVDFFTRVKAGYILDICEKKFRGAANVDALDVGCGVGNFGKLLGDKFHSLKGVDISPASIERARLANSPVEFMTYDGLTLPYDADQFDLAFTICVMHHVPTAQWPLFVSEMARVVRPGGLVVVFEHNPRNPLTMRAVNNCPFDEDAELLRQEKVVELLQEAKLADIDSRFILSIPAGNKALRTVDGFFSKIPFGAQYYVTGEKR